MQWKELYDKAAEKLAPRAVSPFIEAGGVAAAILTAAGNVYVVSLGRISTLLEVPADIVAKDGIHGTAGIEGLGELLFHCVKDTEAEEAEAVREGF